MTLLYLAFRKHLSKPNCNQPKSNFHLIQTNILSCQVKNRLSSIQQHPGVLELSGMFVWRSRFLDCQRVWLSIGLGSRICIFLNKLPGNSWVQCSFTTTAWRTRLEYHLVNAIHMHFAHSEKLRHVGVIFISELCFQKAGTMTANCFEQETLQPCKQRGREEHLSRGFGGYNPDKRVPTGLALMTWPLCVFLLVAEGGRQVEALWWDYPVLNPPWWPRSLWQQKGVSPRCGPWRIILDWKGFLICVYYK